MRMKITKGRLKQIIKEELDMFSQSRRRVPTSMIDERGKWLAQEVANIVVSEKEWMDALKSGQMSLKEVAKEASEIFLETKMRTLRKHLMLEQQLGYLENLLEQAPAYEDINEDINEEEKEVDESRQGGSSQKRKGDRDLSTTSTNMRDREKRGKLHKKYHSAKAGGAKKQMKRQSTKKEREAGKKQAKEEG